MGLGLSQKLDPGLLGARIVLVRLDQIHEAFLKRPGIAPSYSGEAIEKRAPSRHAGTCDDRTHDSPIFEHLRTLCPAKYPRTATLSVFSTP